MNRCVLISDVQMASRRMLRFAMGLKGLEALESADVNETLSLLAKHRVDLLIVSFYPEENDGYMVLDRVKESFCSAELPVILIGDRALRAEFDLRQAHSAAWLDRPFQISELMNLVERILNIVSETAKQSEFAEK